MEVARRISGYTEEARKATTRMDDGREIVVAGMRVE